MVIANADNGVNNGQVFDHPEDNYELLDYEGEEDEAADGAGGDGQDNYDLLDENESGEDGVIEEGHNNANDGTIKIEENETDGNETGDLAGVMGYFNRLTNQ